MHFYITISKWYQKQDNLLQLSTGGKQICTEPHWKLSTPWLSEVFSALHLFNNEVDTGLEQSRIGTKIGRMDLLRYRVPPMHWASLRRISNGPSREGWGSEIKKERVVWRKLWLVQGWGYLKLKSPPHREGSTVTGPGNVSFHRLEFEYHYNLSYSSLLNWDMFHSDGDTEI